jgi:hypothetical protein
MHLLKIVIILGVVLFLLFSSIYLFYYLKNNSYSAKDKVSILMAGRSTTDLWFRYWNLPGILNKISVWRNWPLPYKKYAENGYYFEYFSVPAPKKSEEPNGYFGQAMYQRIVDQLKANKYNILSFKYCFVDFGDNSITSQDEAEQRFSNLTSLVEKVHNLAREKNMKLLLYTALPSFQPGEYAQMLRIKFNRWIEDYSKSNDDVFMVDLYKNLTDDEGKLKAEYSVDPSDSDSHMNMASFFNIDKELKSVLSNNKLK